MVTMYTGRETAVKTAGNLATILAPIVSDTTLKTATVAEVDAGHAFQCAIKRIGVTGAASMSSEQYLCDIDEVETAGPVKWSVEALEIDAGDPQQPNEMIDGLTKGEIVYLIERRGLPHADPFAAGQLVSIARLEYSHAEWVEAQSNTDGEKFRRRLHFAVKAYEPNATISA